MTDKSDPRKISDNPTAKELKSGLGLLHFMTGAAGVLASLGVKSDAIKNLKSQVNDLLSQVEILDMPDQFNSAFAGSGWVAVGGALSVDLIKEAISLHNAGKGVDAENLILDWFTEDNIRLFAITRARRFHKASLRDDQLQEALKLYLEGRYMASVPLILIACDGFASDVSGESPFKENADLSIFDSIVGHPTSLPALISLYKKGVYASSDAEIPIAYRHGVLHGRSLGYANKMTCAKAWLLMMALVDWAIEKQSEDRRREDAQRKESATFSDALKNLARSHADKLEIEAFEKRVVNGPFSEPFANDSAEFAVAEFMSGWAKKNYGMMARHSVNFTKQPINMMAGQMRRAAEFNVIKEYEIRRISYLSVARTEIRLYVKAANLSGDVEGFLDLIVFRYSEDGSVALPSESGTWAVQPNCIYKVGNGALSSD